ncbi:MAG TPA: ABC transporter permease [Gaiellaceae bacterium]|jgi:ABC-type transport system involved in multi-copper enzyme maturation permease subunit|nr:ABC transporter permease [Gaiellaceae bacterium]
MNPRLANAEFLKLRKRRGLVAAVSAVTILPMVVAYVVLLVLHANDPGKHGPAGGLENFMPSIDILTTLTILAAVLIGATLGTGDLTAGVFRELVVTGRSRLSLFTARIPAGLAVLLAPVAVAFGITAAASRAFAGSLEAPSSTVLAQSGAWLALMAGVSMVIALGVSSLFSSRGTSIGILLGWQLGVMPVLLAIGSLGSFREGLFYAAADRLQPAALADGPTQVPMAVATAVVVLVAWTVIPLAFGAWRTQTRDA